MGKIATIGLIWLAAIVSSYVAAEWYRPTPNSFNRPFKFFGLGDGFRPEYWGLQ